MMTTSYKSQGRTFSEVMIDTRGEEFTTLNLGFVPDPFAELLMKSQDLLEQQRESGLKFDEEKLIALREELRETVSKMDITVITTTERQVILDNDHVVNPSLIWFDETMQDGDKLYVDWVKRRESRPDMQVLPKATVHDEIQFDVVLKHPYIFKITDLVEDPTEFERLTSRLESDKQFQKYYGFKMAPIYVEAIPDANIVARTADETMKKLVKLAADYKVEIYFGTKTALKTVMYQFMYGARREDMDLSNIEEISLEKAADMVDKQRKVAIVGGTGIGASLAAAMKGFRAGQMEVIGSGKGMWDFEDFAAIAKVDYPSRDWEQSKLRRGKGHNKFKRKGKK